jgi:hypothetical protein
MIANPSHGIMTLLLPERTTPQHRFSTCLSRARVTPVSKVSRKKDIPPRKQKTFVVKHQKKTFRKDPGILELFLLVLLAGSIILLFVLYTRG